MTDGEADLIGRQLIRQAEVIAQLRKDLDRLANEVTTAVEDVLSRRDVAEADSAAGGSSVTAWCWRDIGPSASEQLWTELGDWVAWVRNRYPLARRIPDCWAQHPEVVEELTALWLAWCAAYTERDAPLTAAIDWHDRWLPGVLYRFEHGAFALDCSRHHQDRPQSSYAGSTGSRGTAVADTRRSQK